MAHEDEYHPNMVALLQLVWGEGYMAPGGPGNVARILRGIETRGRRILDIGCGLGGPAIEMATRHGAKVVGIDLEAPLIEKAREAAAEKGLEASCRFQRVKPGPLPFEDRSFDVVVSSGAVTQTPEKSALFAEARRVLKPGGWFSCYEWLRTDRDYSDAMRYWFELEGLTYAMWTYAQYHELLLTTGFEAVSVEDATDWYRAEARREYERLTGELRPRMVELLGSEDAAHFIENWRAMIVVIESGEMRQGYFRGRRPPGEAHSAANA